MVVEVVAELVLAALVDQRLARSVPSPMLVATAAMVAQPLGLAVARRDRTVLADLVLLVLLLPFTRAVAVVVLAPEARPADIPASHRIAPAASARPAARIAAALVLVPAAT